LSQEPSITEAIVMLQIDHAAERQRMVERQLKARGIGDPRVLAAMAEVPRELFVPQELVEFAYEDSPLPILEGQTISQPYIVALMAEAARIGPDDRVLEVGTGSGYAAAIYAKLARKVYTIERHAALAEGARQALRRAGIANVEVFVGDGSLGLPQYAPFDAIIVAAGAPAPPDTLKHQLADGGRLVIPVSVDGHQELRVITRQGDHFNETDLGPVQFVPLVGEQGWQDAEVRKPAAARVRRAEGPALLREDSLPRAIGAAAQPLDSIDGDAVAGVLGDVADVQVALIGEASHGTSEFYRARAAITRRLIERHGFTIVAVEADWPDAARIDRYVRHRAPGTELEAAFTRFPTWMWRNEEVLGFVEWLRRWNADQPPERRASFHGLDLYGLSASIAAVLAYLQRVDPAAAAAARERYACLTPWQRDPAAYGRAALYQGMAECEAGVVQTLRDLLSKRLDYAARDPDDYLEAEGNARLVADAEVYYRTLYYGRADSWNQRDRHMFATLERVLEARGPGRKAVVWAHNSHVGNAAATEMGQFRDELNIGQLARERYATRARLVGFGTDHGFVAAASDWDGPMEIKAVTPAHRDSYEYLFHQAGMQALALDLRDGERTDLGYSLLQPRLQRAIGVIYRPDTELASHYFEAILPRQFDHYLWFDATSPVQPLPAQPDRSDLPETYPFGL
jgi:protein-L-isoaspartate(D-aspartate) O-methyltransferase